MPKCRPELGIHTSLPCALFRRCLDILSLLSLLTRLCNSDFNSYLFWRYHLKQAKYFLAKHDGATGSGTHLAHPYNLVSICPPVQNQGRFLLFDQPFIVSKMQRGMQGAQGLHIQASGNMELYMEHPKRKQSCSEPVQRASVSLCISFNSYLHSCMICVQWLIHKFKLPGANI